MFPAPGVGWQDIRENQGDRVAGGGRGSSGGLQLLVRHVLQLYGRVVQMKRTSLLGVGEAERTANVLICRRQ